MRQRFSKRAFHISMVVGIVIIIAFIALMMALKYDVDGETDMPFDVKKISVISTVDGQNVENSTAKWDLNVNQNNDIYVYIEKNENYKKTETINNVYMDNFKIINKPVKGSVVFYKPSNNSTSIFQNLDEYKIENINYVGSKNSDMKNMQISNQGGIVVFRCSNNGLGEYISNEDEQIEYNSLLKKIKVVENEVKMKISFDMTIILNSGVVFKASNIELELPYNDIVEKGTTSGDITDLKDIVFKRVEK